MLSIHFPIFLKTFISFVFDVKRKRNEIKEIWCTFHEKVRLITMPTRVNISKRSYLNEGSELTLRGGETAVSHEFNWVAQQLQNSGNEHGNDSTMSHGFFENVATKAAPSAYDNFVIESTDENMNPKDFHPEGFVECIDPMSCHGGDDSFLELRRRNDQLHQSHSSNIQQNKKNSEININPYRKQSSQGLRDGDHQKQYPLQDSSNIFNSFRPSNPPPDNNDDSSTGSNSILSTTLSEHELMTDMEQRSESTNITSLPHESDHWSKVKPSHELQTVNDRLSINLEKTQPLNLDDTAYKIATLSAGINEKKYMDNHKHYIESRIQAFRKANPGKLPDYKNMNPEERKREHQRVMDLLQRLGVGNNVVAACVNAKKGFSENNLISSRYEGNKSISSDYDNNDMNLSLDERFDNSTKMRASKFETDSRHSQEPSYCNSEAKTRSRSSNHKVEDVSHVFSLNDNDNDDDNSTNLDEYLSAHSPSSVELARRDQQCGSPDIKRQKPTNDNNSFDASSPRMFELQNNTTPCRQKNRPSDFLEHSIGRLSIEDGNAFTASQSPIQICSGSRMSSIGALNTAGLSLSQASFGGKTNDTPSTCFNAQSVEETMMMNDKRVRWDYEGRCTKEAPTAVRLKDGEVFHLKPLKTDCPRRDTFKSTEVCNSFRYYPEKVQRRLNHVFNWLLRRDQMKTQQGMSKAAIVLSVPAQHVVDLVLQLLLTTSNRKESATYGSQSADMLQGKTLIITRTKEELEGWGRSLREGSTLSVLNHPSLPLKQRKTQSSAAMCTKYDVVMTTYDAIKSPDVTVTLDSDGYAINHQTGVENGWYASKSVASETEVQDYKQLSILLRVNWRRVVFVDESGRKSFLLKLGTSRSMACTALNAKSR